MTETVDLRDATRADPEQLRTSARGWHGVQRAALATTSAWWPDDAADDGLVSVSTSQGSLCGLLLDSSDGTVRLDSSGRSVAVPLDQVSGIESVTGCPG